MATGEPGGSVDLRPVYCAHSDFGASLLHDDVLPDCQTRNLLRLDQQDRTLLGDQMEELRWVLSGRQKQNTSCNTSSFFSLLVILPVCSV
ncbi:hypothetical protein GJAV_G00229000 [Gymnothorax javanicus]|nr:hypothetical protein GJAV_G00229000 [Gymnothorax javanicus]